MSSTEALLRLHDLDLLVRELTDPESRTRLARLGFELAGHESLERSRARLAAEADARWLTHYERARVRYGRGVAQVRGRACQGCYMTLATSASPGAGGSLTLCESCGRVLYWP